MLLGKFPDLPLLVKTELFHSDSIECRTCTHSLYVYIPQSSSSLLKVRNVKHEEPQVFILVLLAGINKLGNNLTHDIELGFMVLVKISSVQLSFGIIYTLFTYKETYLLMPLLFAQQLWIWNEYFSGLIFDLKFFSNCNDYIQAEYLNLDYNITSDLQTIHCYSWSNCQITHLATIHTQCYFIIKIAN